MRARKGWAAVFAALVMTAVQAANLSVTDVKIAQRYPWNGLVDITYTVNCDDPNKDVWVYPVGYDADTATSVALMPENLTGEGVNGAVRNGTHRMTWDMAKQMGKNYNRAAFSVTLHAYCDAAPYMVIDLSTGSEAEKYPVSYLPEIPKGGWTDEPYKTTKMVFRLVTPGNASLATVTRPYYFAIYPMTEQQYCLVAGGTPGSRTYEDRTKGTPTGWMKEVSYNEIRGEVLGAKWPIHQQVDAQSLVGKMRIRTGITIDLPTLAQHFRALITDVGSGNNPNSWGIYKVDSIGEWCLDWGCDDKYINGSEMNEKIMPWGVDPVGPVSSYNGLRVACFGTDYYGRIGCYYAGQQLSGNPVSFSTRFTPDKTYFTSAYDRLKNSYECTCFGARLVALPVCK